MEKPATHLAKHTKYHKYYTPNDIFWGLGIEHETYIETSVNKHIGVIDLSNCTARERYSLDYYLSYKSGKYADAIRHLGSVIGWDKKLVIPFLMNSHSLQNADIYGEHITLYSKQHGQPNPKFSGKTALSTLQEMMPDVFRNGYEEVFTFDGDTIEFMTLNFYNASVKEVIHELRETQNKFINGLNTCAVQLDASSVIHTHHPFSTPKYNYGFASYLTNSKNIAIFNNSTLHINITLPTELNEHGVIKNMRNFTERHRSLARALQWFEPFIIAKYCSADPFHSIPGIGASAGSQRLAVSRYIGIGTFDTDAMQRGKILMKPRKDVWSNDLSYNWQDKFNSVSAYRQLDIVGMDINFNKHYNHGIEFRILDGLHSYEDIEDVLKECLIIANFSEMKSGISNPRLSPIWHTIVYGVMMHGKEYYLGQDEIELVSQLCGLDLYSKIKGDVNIVTMYTEIMRHFFSAYSNGPMSAALAAQPALPAQPAVTKATEVPQVPQVPQVNMGCCMRWK
jgi:hypothetical protein